MFQTLSIVSGSVMTVGNQLHIPHIAKMAVLATHRTITVPSALLVLEQRARRAQPAQPDREKKSRPPHRPTQDIWVLSRLQVKIQAMYIDGQESMGFNVSCVFPIFYCYLTLISLAYFPFALIGYVRNPPNKYLQSLITEQAAKSNIQPVTYWQDLCQT